MKKKYLFLFSLCLSLVFNLQAQTIAGWDLTGLTNVATATATTFNTNLETTSNGNVMTRGAGAAASAGNNSFRTVGFQNNGIAVTNTDYFQITLKAMSGNALSISSIDARFAGTSGFAAAPGVSNQFAYSLDGTNFILIGTASVTIGTPATLPTINTSTINDLQNVPATTTVTLRYYASGQTTTGGWGFNSPSAGILGLAIGGTVNPAVSPASLIFTPVNLPNFCFGGSIIDSTTLSGSNLTGSDIIVGPYSDFGFSTSLAGPFVPSLPIAYTGNTLNPIKVYIQYAPTMAGPFSGSIGVAGGGASTTIPVSNTVYNLPTVTANANASTYCEGNNVTLQGGGAIGYAWTGGIQDNTPFPALLNTTTYTVVGTDGNGCTNSSVVSFTVNPKPNLSITQDPISSCYGISRTLTASGASSYVWTGGITNGTAFVNLNSTTYMVTGTDALGCTNTATHFVDVNPYYGNLAWTDINNSSTMPGPLSATVNFIQPENSQVIYSDIDCMVLLCLTSGTSLGNTSATVNIADGTPNYNGQPYVSRWWEVTPTNNIPATVTLFLTQDDFDKYNANNGNFPDLPTSGNSNDPNIIHIRVTKVDGSLGSGLPTVITPMVLWNPTFHYWILDFPVTGFSQFYVHAANPGNVPLPVYVSSFSGEQRADGNAITWVSENESNIDSYQLQYSSDGIHFNTLYESKAKFKNASGVYTWLDKTAHAGHNYYRLQVTDLNGTTNLQEKTLDLVRAEAGFTITVFPTVCNTTCQLQVAAPRASKMVYQIMDMTGTQLQQQEITVDAGLNKVSMPIQQLAQGVYFCRILQNGQILSTQKIIKE